VEGGALAIAPLVQGLAARGCHGANDGTTMTTKKVSWWCKQKREKRNQEKMKVIGPLMPLAKNP